MEKNNNNQSFQYFVGIVLIIVFVIGFYQNSKIRKDKEKNSLSNIEKCIKKESSDLVSKESVKNACTDKIQKIDRSISYKGKAGYRYKDGKAYSFEGNVVNKTDNFIITQYSISVTHYVNYGDISETCKVKNMACRRIIHKDTRKGQWIEPQENGIVYLKLKNTLMDKTEKNINFEILEENVFYKGKKDNTHWKMFDIYGVSILD